MQAGKALDLPVYFGDAGSSAVLHSLGAHHAACAVITLDTPGAPPSELNGSFDGSLPDLGSFKDMLWKGKVRRKVLQYRTALAAAIRS